MKILFTYLVAFSGHGGIQKFNKCFIQALYELSLTGKFSFKVASLYDEKTDETYLPKENFISFHSRTLLIVLAAIFRFTKYNIVILGHINMSILGVLIKFFSPKTKVILVTHGIEVWCPLTFWGKRLLKKADGILAVSQYTKEQLMERHGVNETLVKVFHNTIDPHFIFPEKFEKPLDLYKRYKLNADDKIIFTVARMASTEKYKGYDKVIEAIGLLKDPKIKYLMGGKCNDEEAQRILTIATEAGVRENIQLLGYIKDEELTQHYLMSDLFVMPSKKEGFGIVFIEAMACGLHVIAGNKDGSVDALKNGELGILIDPDSVEEIALAIRTTLEQKINKSSKESLQQTVVTSFGFEKYKQNLAAIISTYN